VRGAFHASLRCARPWPAAWSEPLFQHFHEHLFETLSQHGGAQRPRHEHSGNHRTRPGVRRAEHPERHHARRDRDNPQGARLRWAGHASASEASRTGRRGPRRAHRRDGPRPEPVATPVKAPDMPDTARKATKPAAEASSPASSLRSFTAPPAHAPTSLHPRAPRSRPPGRCRWCCCTVARSRPTISPPAQMNCLADECSWSPRAAPGANPSRCWNWFRSEDQQRGSGEPAFPRFIVMAVGDEVAWTRSACLPRGFRRARPGRGAGRPTRAGPPWARTRACPCRAHDTPPPGAEGPQRLGRAHFPVRRPAP
jgi:hypothetical protein